MTITVRDARSNRDDREWIRTVYRDYLSELSVAKSGLFPALGEWDARESEFLAGWFSDFRAFPFVILSERERCGFALVTRSIGGEAGPSHRLSEFFVVRSARRRGVGRAAATLIFQRFAGQWEIVEDDENRSALVFWRRVLAEFTLGRFNETRLGGEVRHTFSAVARAS